MKWGLGPALGTARDPPCLSLAYHSWGYGALPSSGLVLWAEGGRSLPAHASKHELAVVFSKCTMVLRLFRCVWGGWWEGAFENLIKASTFCPGKHSLSCAAEVLVLDPSETWLKHRQDQRMGGRKLTKNIWDPSGRGVEQRKVLRLNSSPMKEKMGSTLFQRWLLK